MAIFDTKNDVFDLIEKFDKSSLSELEISNNDLNIKLSKQPPNSVYISEPQNIPPIVSTVKQEMSVEISQGSESADANAKDDKIIKAPLIGTFYSAPSPDSEPYAKVGDVINKGMVLCVIEAMKTMNEIESETDGEIAEVLVVSGTPVEFGQALFRLR
jgi:acetyl-CoA carboxylase biotin carboxyl carrier protein